MRSRKNAWVNSGGLLVCILLLGLCLPVVGVAGGENQRLQDEGALHARLAERVRHELVMLPYYGVFDNLEFDIEDVDTVVLSGQVTRPTLKSDAVNVVQRLEGVGKVVDNIEVLPLSPHDDRIRLKAYRAVYSTTGLEKYALRAVPPIHIVVRRGHVTLVGAVATETDRDLAGLKALGVPGVFSVTNSLRVDNPRVTDN